MPKITMYTTTWCGYCVRAKALLEHRGVPYDEVVLDDRDAELRATLEQLTGGTSLPQIVIDGETIGGYAELVELDRSGALARHAA